MSMARVASVHGHVNSDARPGPTVGRLAPSAVQAEAGCRRDVGPQRARGRRAGGIRGVGLSWGTSKTFTNPLRSHCQWSPMPSNICMNLHRDRSLPTLPVPARRWHTSRWRGRWPSQTTASPLRSASCGCPPFAPTPPRACSTAVPSVACMRILPVPPAEAAGAWPCQRAVC